MEGKTADACDALLGMLEQVEILAYFVHVNW
jgi:hypothetical protein